MSQFYAVEVDAYQPGGSAAVAPVADAWGVFPWGALSVQPTAPESYSTLRASDLGYRTAPTEGVTVYPPFLQAAFSIDRRLNLAPTDPAAAAGWGSVQFANAGGRYDSIAATQNSDGRGVRVFAGVKEFDPVRGIEIDPPASSLTALFTGIAQPWFCSDTSLDVPLRDATYWIERPVQSALYGGTGGLDGGTDLTGLPKPKTRGRAMNVAPVLIDAVNRVYQWTDGPGTISAVYEGGGGSISFQYDVPDLYAGSTAPGQFRTNAARGLFQLGSNPVQQITADVTGGPSNLIGGLAKSLLLDDLGLPASLLDTASFDALPTYQAGVFLGAQPADGAATVGMVLGSIGAKLIPLRNGRLRAFLLWSLPEGIAPVIRLDTSNAVSVTPQAIGAPLDPPPYRWQVGYGRCWTVQTSGLLGSVDPARKTFISAQDRFAVWASTDVLRAYRRPNDPPPVPGCLIDQAAALEVANKLGALWGVRRRLYAVTVPVPLGMLREFGDVVQIAWPMDDLRGARVGQVVGEQFRAGDSTITLMVLV